MAAPRRYLQTFDVFVGNLPEDADQKKVGKLFNKFGETTAIIIRDSNQLGTKLAYVKYLCEEDAKRAVEDGCKMDMDGQKLLVRKADQRKRTGGGGGGPGIKPLMQMGLSHKEPDLVSNLETSSNTSSKDVSEEVVLVTHAETPITVFVQIKTDENMNEVANVLQQLANLCPSAPKLSGPPEYSKVYAAKFSEDEQWYRCQIKQIYGTDKVKILFIDYGNSEDTDPACLVEIPEEIKNYSPFALKLVLHNIRSKDLGCSKGTAFLQQLTLFKEFRAVFKRRLTDGSGYYAELFHEGESIIDRVVAEGHGILRQTQKPLGTGTQGSTDYGGGYGDGMMKSSTNRSNNSRDMNMSLSGLDKSALQAKKRELDKVTTERDMLNVELTNMRGKMKNLQSEYSTVSNKLLENSLSQLLQIIISLATRVKQIRSQFPIDKNSPLDDGVSIILGDNKLHNIQIETLPPVVSTLSTYRAAQKEISICKDKSELEEMINTRDSARRELFDKLKICVTDLEQFPLEERGVEVKSCLELLEKNYGYFLKYSIPIPSAIIDLLPTYNQWKEKKKQEFEESRKHTDTCKQSVLSSLMEFHSLISLEEVESNIKVNYDLDGQLKQYISILQSEINQSDTEQGHDTSFIASIVQSVCKELQQECSCIDNYSQLMGEFKQMITDIQPWLTDKPSTQELQATRKSLRSLKSKLRHRLADKVDHEENEGEGSELDEIKTDINEIRNEIHNILLQENKQLALISKLAEEHFPEVLSEFSDYGIDNQLMYHGLVKDSYEVDHYDLSPVSDDVNDLYESVFFGETVFIRDYLLSDGDRLNKDQFLTQCYNYYQIRGEYLHSIDTVFFNKVGRRGYIISPKDGELLTSVLESGIRPNSKAIQQIIRCVSKALGALHAKNYIHGDITPQNILMRDDGSAILMEPDFSRSVTDRCRKIFTTKSGLEFVPPEIKNMCEVTPSVDLYNLGLLILWLHYPDSNVGLLPDNVPDFTNLPLDQSTQMILRSLLSSIPHLRPSVELLLQSPYHTMDLPDNLITSSPHFISSPSFMGHGNGDSFNIANIRPNDVQTTSFIDPRQQIYCYSTNLDMTDYSTQHSESHPDEQFEIGTISDYTNLQSQSRPNEPFEIGTFDLNEAMSFIPDQVDESSSESNPSVINNQQLSQSELNEGGGGQMSDILVSAELENLSVAENTNNSNIEAEKLIKEDERETSTADSTS